MAFDFRTAAKVAGVDADWYENEQQMLEDLQQRAKGDPAMREAIARDRNVRQSIAQRTPSQQPRRPVIVSPMAMGVGMAAAIPAMQAKHQSSIHGDIMSAIQRENDSRVAQAREMRRMQHEKDMLLMRLRAMRGE